MASTAEIRSWAKEFGMAVGVRGRLHPDVVAAYERAHTEGAEDYSDLKVEDVPHTRGATSIDDLSPETVAHYKLDEEPSIKFDPKAPLSEKTAAEFAKRLEEGTIPRRKLSPGYMTGFCQFPGKENGHRYCHGRVTNGNGAFVICVCTCHADYDVVVL